MFSFQVIKQLYCRETRLVHCQCINWSKASFFYSFFCIIWYFRIYCKSQHPACLSLSARCPDMVQP